MKTNVGNLRIETRDSVVEFTLLEAVKGRNRALLTYEGVEDLIRVLKGLKRPDDDVNEAMDLV